MKNLILNLFVLTTFILTSCANAQTTKTNLTATEFDTKIKATSSAIILDVRTPQEYNEGHLKNAKNIDWNGSAFENETAKLDKTKPVFVYCLAGGRSAAAAKKLRGDGFKKVYELNGGIKEWKENKLPVTTN